VSIKSRRRPSKNPNPFRTHRNEDESGGIDSFDDALPSIGDISPDSHAAAAAEPPPIIYFYQSAKLSHLNVL